MVGRPEYKWKKETKKAASSLSNLINQVLAMIVCNSFQRMARFETDTIIQTLSHTNMLKMSISWKIIPRSSFSESDGACICCYRLFWYMKDFATMENSSVYPYVIDSFSFSWNSSLLEKYAHFSEKGSNKDHKVSIDAMVDKLQVPLLIMFRV